MESQVEDNSRNNMIYNNFNLKIVNKNMIYENVNSRNKNYQYEIILDQSKNDFFREN